eukprot:4583504-Prymnesium_polylepis.1
MSRQRFEGFTLTMERAPVKCAARVLEPCPIVYMGSRGHDEVSIDRAKGAWNLRSVSFIEPGRWLPPGWEPGAASR